MKIIFTQDIMHGSKMDGNGFAVNETLAPGTAQWLWNWDDTQVRGLMFMCPCNCKVIRSVNVIQAGLAKGPPPPGTWAWDGNMNQPTLQPSIQVTSGCKWHGHLTAGEWTP